jgi:hypothetical protein
VLVAGDRTTILAQAPEAALLDPTDTIERELGPRQEHYYQLAVAKDECVSVIVEQRGIDVIVQTRHPNGRVIADVQLEITRGGDERVDLVAEVAGMYVLAVRSTPGTGAGSYSIRVAGRKAASDADRSMQEVWAARTEASRLRSAGKFTEAKTLFEGAVAAAETVRGADDGLVGVLLTDLASNALLQRDDNTAEPLLQRAIAILEKVWGDPGWRWSNSTPVVFRVPRQCSAGPVTSSNERLDPSTPGLSPA